jgi:hypothetical protein
MSDYAQGKNPNSLANLLPQPPEGAQRKGAYAAHRIKHKNKQIKDVIQYLINLPINEGKPQELKNIMQAKTKNLAVIDAMVVAQIKKAVTGDTRAFTALIDAVARKELITESEISNTKSADDILLEALMARDIGPLSGKDDVFEEDDDAGTNS